MIPEEVLMQEQERLVRLIEACSEGVEKRTATRLPKRPIVWRPVFQCSTKQSIVLGCNKRTTPLFDTKPFMEQK